MFSNSAFISLLNTGTMRREELESCIATTVRTVGKDGRVRYQGTPALKETQLLGGFKYPRRFCNSIHCVAAPGV